MQTWQLVRHFRRGALDALGGGDVFVGGWDGSVMLGEQHTKGH